MDPGQSHAGITVPEGDPEAVRSMAHTFKGLAGSLERSAHGFGAMPGELSSWQGPASVAFASVAQDSRAAASEGSVAFARKAHAADRLADQLEQAQRETRRAISDAKDAERRIRTAKHEIADARGRHQQALERIAVADLVIAAGGLIGAGATGAHAERDQAQRDADQAEDDQRRAEKALERAQNDLQDAQRAGAPNRMPNTPPPPPPAPSQHLPQPPNSPPSADPPPASPPTPPTHSPASPPSSRSRISARRGRVLGGSETSGLGPPGRPVSTRSSAKTR